MSYSEYWRVNKSVIDYVELANALRALRKIVSVMDLDAEVVWAGMPCRAEKRIELPASLAKGDYPIPSDKMDILVGLNVHETLHFLEESEHAWGYLSHSFLSMKEKTLLGKLFEAGEDIHVDGVAIRRGVPGHYVKKSRSWWQKNFQEDFTEGMATPERLFGIWSYLMLDVVYPDMNSREMEQLVCLSCDSLETLDCDRLVESVCCGRKMPMLQVIGTMLSMPEDYMAALEMLLSKTPDIINSDAIGRALVYRELWERLESHFGDWDAKMKAAEAAGELTEPPATSGGLLVDETKISAELADKIQQAVATEAEEITEAIKAALKSVGAGEEGQHLYPAVFENALEPLEKEPNLDVVRSLTEIFRLWLEETLRVNRGLDSGTLDPKRVHRTPTTGRVFKQKEYHRQNLLWNIIVLIDASGSVGWFWPQIQSIYGALAASLRGDNIHLDILGYRETADTCQIKNFFHSNRLYTVEPEGDTPSGEAIVAAALRMPPHGEKLIIHITDGLKNVGLPIESALDYCAAQGIDLVTLGVGQAARPFATYGDSFQMLGTEAGRLPHAVGALLKRKLVRSR
ncbi:MAG: vWA domain-containing protein [Chloroflexota bacterium]|nr:vWA domain-containing protein [Chloroflexota bacterium]